VPPAPKPAPAQLSLFDDPAPSAEAALLRHPRATHEVDLGGHVVGYALRRGRRGSIGFVVGADGLAVSAPRWVGGAEIDAALRAKSGWILAKLQQQRERARRLAAARVDWKDGVEIPFLGAPVAVRLDPGARSTVFDADARRLCVALPHGATPAQIRDAVQSWLQRQARRLFEERAAFFAARIGVRVRRLSLSSAATRWGSASADGSIRLHWRLVHFALPVVDYVVAHEIAHLREMNHGPAFWDVVRAAVPGFEHSRSALRDEVLPVFD
jgi:predicted metal-dependent hydrolase